MSPTAWRGTPCTLPRPPGRGWRSTRAWCRSPRASARRPRCWAATRSRWRSAGERTSCSRWPCRRRSIPPPSTWSSAAASPPPPTAASASPPAAPPPSPASPSTTSGSRNGPVTASGGSWRHGSDLDRPTGRATAATALVTGGDGLGAVAARHARHPRSPVVRPPAAPSRPDRPAPVQRQRDRVRTDDRERYDRRGGAGAAPATSPGRLAADGPRALGRGVGTGGRVHALWVPGPAGGDPGRQLRCRVCLQQLHSLAGFPQLHPAADAQRVAALAALAVVGQGRGGGAGAVPRVGGALAWIVGAAVPIGLQPARRPRLGDPVVGGPRPGRRGDRPRRADRGGGAGAALPPRRGVERQQLRWVA